MARNRNFPFLQRKRPKFIVSSRIPSSTTNWRLQNVRYIVYHLQKPFCLLHSAQLWVPHAKIVLCLLLHTFHNSIAPMYLENGRFSKCLLTHSVSQSLFIQLSPLFGQPMDTPLCVSIQTFPIPDCSFPFSPIISCPCLAQKHILPICYPLCIPST